MVLSQIQAASFSLFWETLFLGIHSVLIIGVLWIWTSRKTPKKVHYMLYVALATMYLIAVAHSGIILARSVHPETLGKSLQIQQSLTTLAIFQFLFGDYVIMWRAWVVWNYNYFVMILPFCISCTAFGFALATVKGGKKLSIESPALLVANFLVCTGLIIGRIAYVNYHSRGSQNLWTTLKKSPYKGIIFLLSETGALYTAVQITSLILFKRRSTILNVFLDLMVPLMGLLPSTIVVLVALDVLPSGAASTKDGSTIGTAIRFQHTETSTNDDLTAANHADNAYWKGRDKTGIISNGKSSATGGTQIIDVDTSAV